MVREPHTLGRKLVDIRRFYLFLAITAEVAIAEVIGHDVDYVGWFRTPFTSGK
jgi:hypothetical protein